MIFNGSVSRHEKLFNVLRCSMYIGVQFGRFHCIYRIRLADGFSPVRLLLNEVNILKDCTEHHLNDDSVSYYSYSCDTDIHITSDDSER